MTQKNPAGSAGVFRVDLIAGAADVLLGKKNGAMRGLLWKMTDDGQVRTENGKYLLPLPNPSEIAVAS